MGAHSPRLNGGKDVQSCLPAIIREKELNRKIT